MKLKMLDQVMEFQNNQHELERLFEVIVQVIEESNRQFSHLVVDGVVVYDEPYEYLLEQLETVQEIQVMTLTLNEYIHELLLSASDYIKRATPEIEKLSAELYQGSEDSSWEKLGQLLEGLQWIIQTHQAIEATKNLNQFIAEFDLWLKYSEEVNKIQGVLEGLHEGIENEDVVYIADMLLYEFIPVFKQMKSHLEVLTGGGSGDDVLH